MDVETLALAVVAEPTLRGGLGVLRRGISADPDLLEDLRVRELVDSLIEAALASGWSTDHIREVLGMAAYLLTW